MIKSFLILLIFPIFLFSAQQIVLVVAEDFNTSHADLEFYEGEKLLLSSKVNLGTHGLGWGLGEKKLTQKQGEPLKHEGDKKAPAGIFQLSATFGYANNVTTKLPYIYASKELICVDDSHSPFYNQIIQAKGNEKSFEYMRRKDAQYELGVVVRHNKMAQENRGSCIFLHVQKEEGHSTAGCTSMALEKLKTIVKMLDEEKNPILIQIPKQSKEEIIKLYPQLKHSSLLQ